MAKKKAKSARKQKRDAASERPSLTPDFWERQSENRRHVFSIVLLAVLSFSFFGPIHFSDKGLVATDTVQWRSMAASMLDHEEATGETPLWAAYPFAGMPGYMITAPTDIVQIDDLFSWLRLIIWPSSHFLVLLLGMYTLVFYLTRNTWAGVLSACAFGLTTYLPILLIAGHNSKFISLCFAPWLLFAFVYVLRNPGMFTGLLFALIAAANLRAGHVQITYYIVFVCGVWWITEGIGRYREGNLMPFLKSTAWLVGGSLLALMMVAQPYLSSFEYKAYTIRGATAGGEPSGLSWEYAMAWSQGVGEMLTLIIAHAYGGGSSIGYWGAKIFTAGPHYVGGVVVALSIVALWRVKHRTVWALGSATGLMMLFALGEYFPLLNRPMYNYFPLFDAFRVPETWLSVVALTLVVLAGFGLSWVFTSIKENADQARKTVLAAMGGVAGFVVLLLLAGPSMLAFERPNEVAFTAQQIARQYNVPASNPQVVEAAREFVATQKPAREEMFSEDAQRSLLFLVLAGAVLFLLARSRMRVWHAGLLVTLFLVVDLWGVGRRYFNQDSLLGSKRSVENVNTYGFDQYVVQQRDAAGGDGYFRVLSLENAPNPPSEMARPAFLYETLNGYHGAKLRLYQDYLENLLYEPTGLPSLRGLSLLNTKYVLARGQVPGMVPVFTDEATQMVVNEHPDVLPRAYFVGQVEVIEDAETTWARLQDPSFDLSSTAVVAVPLGEEITPLDSTSQVQVSLDQHRAHDISWSVETDAQRLLVVSEVYYPAGWNAYLNGQPVQIHRTNYLVRGVVIPAGAHQLTMRFEPESYTRGLWISGIGTLLVYGGLLVLIGMMFMQRRREQSDAG